MGTVNSKYENKISRELFVDCREAGRLLGISQEQARTYLKRLKQELNSSNVLTMYGKIPRIYFLKRFGLLGDFSKLEALVVNDEMRKLWAMNGGVNDGKK